MNIGKALAVAVLALGTAGLALAASDGGPRGDGEGRHGHRGHGPGRMSVEHVAMHNIMADLLSARTGRTQAEIQALFEKENPHEAFEQLGLDEDEVRPLFQQARKTLIDRAEKARLITSAQADKLRAAKMEMRHKRRPRDDDAD